MAAVDVEYLNELGELVEDLTTTGKPVLDEDQMKKLKKICKKSDLYVDHTFHNVMTQMKKAHAEIRLSCFQIINELFTRSHKFRELLSNDFQVFLELSIGVDDPLPPPSSAAKTLKEKAVTAIEKWQEKYGPHYKKLDLGYNYLKRIKHVQFDSIRERAATEQRRSDDRQRRKHNALLKKLGNVELEIAEQTSQMELCITEINNCFTLLLPSPDDYDVHLGSDDDDDDDTKVPSIAQSNLEAAKKPQDNSSADTRGSSNEVHSDTDLGDAKIAVVTHDESSDDEHDDDDDMQDDKDASQDIITHDESSDDERDDDDDTQDAKDASQDFITHHGLGSRSYQIDIELSKMKPKIHETDDNTDILDTARDMYKEICHKHIPMVNKWLTVLSKAGQLQSRIKSIIDLKQELERARDKFLELDINPIKKQKSDPESTATSNFDDGVDSDDEFEDVPEKEGLEIIPAHKRAEYGLEPLEKSKNSGPFSSNSGKNSPNVMLSKEQEEEEEAILKSARFSRKDAEDPTSLARALLESRKQYLNSLPSTSRQTISMAPQESTHTATSMNTKSDSQTSERKKKLLEVAPVVPFDRDLYYWEKSDFEPPTILKSENFNNHWAFKDVDEEQVLSNEKGSMLRRKIAFAGKFEPVKWACRAALPNGKLCPRRDRVKCPFHGKIIARDERGNPVDETETTESSASTSTASTSAAGTSGQDWKEIQPEIEAATGLDLGGKGKRRKVRAKGDSKELSRKQKYARLTDVTKSKHSPRSRLEKRVLSSAAVKRVTQQMESQLKKTISDKFGDQFNYALH